MANVRTTEYLYDIDIHPIEALPGSGHTWAARVSRVQRAISGEDVRLANQPEHYGATAGAALDAALDAAMESIGDRNPN